MSTLQKQRNTDINYAMKNSCPFLRTMFPKVPRSMINMYKFLSFASRE
jgi:hypothetical protein